MPLAENLAAAEDAVRYVKSLGLKAANKISDRLAAAGGIEQVLGKDQGVRMHDYGEAGLGVGKARSSGLVYIEDKVEHYKKTGFGNCQEQAEIALVHLYQAGILPLDLMCFTDPDYDHVWVGVGLNAGWQPENLRSWGADAVWCDPWQGDGMAFSIDDFVKGKVRNLNTIYKCDSVELVEAGKPTSLFRLE